MAIRQKGLKDALQKRVRFMSMQYVQLPQHGQSLLVVVDLRLLFGARGFRTSVLD